MQLYKSVVTLALLALIMILFTAPAFAEYPWGEEPGRGKAENVLDSDPWGEGPGKGKGNNMLDGHPWIDDPGKRKGNNLLDEHPWTGGGKGKGGVDAGIDWIAYIRGYLRIFY